MFDSPLPIAEPVLRGNRGTVYSVSSFGVGFTTFGPDFSPATHFASDRYRKLDFAHQYPKGTRHDGKVYDFQGRYIKSGDYSATQPFIGSSMPATYVALDQRRPSNPYRLPRLMVRSFTNLVFGEGRFPKLASDDPDTELFCAALLKQAEAAVRFVQARNIGGSVGTVGMSWRFWEGQARIRVHNGKNLIPHSWIDQEQHAVEHVSEITMGERVEYDPKSKKDVRVYVWSRRDWTPTSDIQFCEAVVANPSDPVEWIVDEDNTFTHDDGFPHFVWIRNGADDDDGTDIDGQCDFDGQYEALDNIDLLSSVLSSGTTRNLDPTLVLKLSTRDQAMAQSQGISKGSGNGINVGPNGDAKYLELAGTAVAVGIQLFKENRSSILESAQCVVPSTAELTSAGSSAVAQKMLFAPMLSSTNVHRTQYGGGMVRLFEQMLECARRRYPEIDPETGEMSYPVVLDESPGDVDEGEPREPTEQEVEFYLELPPHIETENVVDEHGEPTGETTKTEKQLVPGRGKIWTEWPPYFEPTATDIQAKGIAISTAAGAKPVLSQQSGVELMASELRVDPKREWTRVAAEQRAAADIDAGMFNGGAGGGVGGRDELPPGAKAMPKPPSPAKGSQGHSDDDDAPKGRDPMTPEERRERDHARYLAHRGQ